MEAQCIKRQRVSWEEDEIDKLTEIMMAARNDNKANNWGEVTARYNKWAASIGKPTRTVNSIKAKGGESGRPRGNLWTPEEDRWLLNYDRTSRSWRQMWVDLAKADISPVPRQQTAVRRHYQILMARVNQMVASTNIQMSEEVFAISTVTSQWTDEENEVLRTIGLDSPMLCDRFNEMMRQSTGQAHYFRNFEAVERQVGKLKAGTVPKRYPNAHFVWTATHEATLREIQRNRYRSRAAVQFAKRLGIDCEEVWRKYKELFKDMIEANMDVPMEVSSENIVVDESELYQVARLEQELHEAQRYAVELTVAGLVEEVVKKHLHSCIESEQGERGSCIDREGYSGNQQRSVWDPFPLSPNMSTPDAPQGMTTCPQHAVSRQASSRYRSAQGTLLDCDLEFYINALNSPNKAHNGESEWEAWLSETGATLAPYSTTQFTNWIARGHVKGGDSLFLGELLFLCLCINPDLNRLIALYREWDELGLSCRQPDCCMNYDFSLINIHPQPQCCHWDYLRRRQVEIAPNLGTNEYKLRCALATLCEGQRTWEQRVGGELSDLSMDEVEVKAPCVLAEYFSTAEVSGYIHLGTMSLVAIELCSETRTSSSTEWKKRHASVGRVRCQAGGESDAILVCDRFQRWFFVVADSKWLFHTTLRYVSWLRIDNFHQQAHRASAIIRAHNPMLLDALQLKRPQMADRGENIYNLFTLWPLYRGELDKLNYGQRAAVNQLLMGKGILPVRGPFGCGKSRTIAVAVSLHHLRCFRRLEGFQQVLIVAESNAAIDSCLTRVVRLGMVEKERIVRLGETTINGLRQYSTYAIMSEAERESRRKFKSWSGKRHQEAARETAASWVRNASTVFATFSGLSTRLADAIRAKMVIVDEAGTVLEPALFQIFERQVETVGMFGDPQQLPPYSLAADDRTVGADVVRSVLTAYDDVWEGHWHGVTLNTQYRCHHQIGDLCARLFYNYSIVHDAEESDNYLESCVVFGREPCRNRRILHLSISPPGEENPIVNGGENWMEAWAVCECLMRIRSAVARRGESRTVLVITPYNGQKDMLERMFYRYSRWWQDMLAVRVRTADSCQGEEEDIAIITFCWRNDEGHVGFLAESKPRLLVPMSRPRDYLVLVAHEPTFREHERRHRNGTFWCDLFDLLNDDMVVGFEDTRSSYAMDQQMRDERHCMWLSGTY